jgi:hypothetical protein
MLERFERQEQAAREAREATQQLTSLLALCIARGFGIQNPATSSGNQGDDPGGNNSAL